MLYLKKSAVGVCSMCLSADLAFSVSSFFFFTSFSWFALLYLVHEEHCVGEVGIIRLRYTIVIKDKGLLETHAIILTFEDHLRK